MAETLLSRVLGFQYQPFTASGAHLDPSVELGDGVTVGKVYSGVFTKDVSHGPLYTADISAPGGEKINYQYEYKSPQERKVERQNREIRASLSIQADRITQEVAERQAQAEEFRATFEVQSQQISAKVSKTGGSSSSFGWELTDTSWTLKANSSTVLQATKSGVEITGKITATSGKIGGFDIQSNYLSYNGQTWGGTNTAGAYIGISGIQLGKNFKVDMQGNLTASSGTFTGNVYAGNIQYGNSAGYLSGSGISSGSISGNRLGANTVTTAYTSGGMNPSLGYADYANGALVGGYNSVSIGEDMFYLGGARVMKASRNIDGVLIRYLTWLA